MADQCQHVLQVWFEEDMDASLNQLAYILEGLEMLVAPDDVKEMIVRTFLAGTKCIESNNNK